MEKIFKVSQNDEGLRLDKFLSLRMVSFSRTRINSLIDQRLVFVDGVIKKPSFQLLADQEIKVMAAEEKAKKVLRLYQFTVKIIYEDEDIIVVDKPEGLTVHPPNEGYAETLVGALLYMKKTLASAEQLRPGVVHRLDKETSGVMVLAKNIKSYDNLISQFKNRTIKKDYLAIVWGKFTKAETEVNLPLGRDKKNRLKMKISLNNSKAAYTKIKLSKKLTDSSLLSIFPHTGRMHQIRVHLKFLGFPIVGDKKYGIKDKYKNMFLHAHGLKFTHPITQKSMSFSSMMPERFKLFIDEHEEQ